MLPSVRTPDDPGNESLERFSAYPVTVNDLPVIGKAFRSDTIHLLARHNQNLAGKILDDLAGLGDPCTEPIRWYIWRALDVFHGYPSLQGRVIQFLEEQNPDRQRRMLKDPEYRAIFRCSNQYDRLVEIVRKFDEETQLDVMHDNLLATSSYTDQEDAIAKAEKSMAIFRSLKSTESKIKFMSAPRVLEKVLEFGRITFNADHRPTIAGEVVAWMKTLDPLSQAELLMASGATNALERDAPEDLDAIRSGFRHYRLQARQMRQS